MDIVGVYEDKGVSGKKLNRPEFVRLRNEITEGEHVVSYSISRLSRSVRDFIEILEWAEDKSITIHTIKEQIDTKSAYGSFTTMLFSALSQLESNLTQERMQEINNRKIKRGETTRAPSFGYQSKKYDEGQPARIIPVLLEQLAINRMIQLRYENIFRNVSLRQLADMVTAEGFKPRRGDKFSAETVRQIMTREYAFRMRVHGMHLIPEDVLRRYIDLQMPFIVPIPRIHEFVITDPRSGREIYNGLYEDATLSIEKPKFFGRGKIVRRIHALKTLTPLDLHLLTYDKERDNIRRREMLEDGEVFQRRIIIECESKDFRKVLEKLLISRTKIDADFEELRMKRKEQYTMAELRYKLHMEESKVKDPNFDEKMDIESLKLRLELATLAKML
jgi:hypothetical protein